jgi:hypothetical protein
MILPVVPFAAKYSTFPGGASLMKFVSVERKLFLEAEDSIVPVLGVYLKSLRIL